MKLIVLAVVVFLGPSVDMTCVLTLTSHCCDNLHLYRASGPEIASDAVTSLLGVVVFSLSLRPHPNVTHGLAVLATSASNGAADGAAPPAGRSNATSRFWLREAEEKKCSSR